VDVSEVVSLLKAFSLFKKRQLSNMKLVLMGKATRSIIEKLDSYKYRQDVCLYPGDGNVRKMDNAPEVRAEVVGGAYAIVRLAGQDSPGMDVLNAWKARVPVIAGQTGGVLTDGPGTGESVLRVAAGDPAPLADALKSLYKDEAFRSGLIEKAALRVAGISLRQSVATIWEAIGRN